MRAPSVCVVLQGGDRFPTDALSDVRRFGFDIAYVVDTREPDQTWSGLTSETIASEQLVAVLQGRLNQVDDTAMIVSARCGFERFNWLDLMPQLALRPRCSAAVAVLSDEPDLAVAALIKDRVVETLSPIDPLAELEGRPDSVTIRYDGVSNRSDGLKPAVFFDRDGVINEDRGYVGDVSRFAFLPGAIAGVKAANDRGALAFLVTNQSGVARGFYTERDVAHLHRHMTQEMRRQGAHFDDIRTCPHLPDGVVTAYRLACRCRKPEPGMLLDLMQDWPVDKTRSAMIGDKASDMQAAQAAGLPGFLYRDGSLSDVVIDALGGD